MHNKWQNILIELTSARCIHSALRTCWKSPSHSHRFSETRRWTKNSISGCRPAISFGVASAQTAAENNCQSSSVSDSLEKAWLGCEPNQEPLLLLLQADSDCLRENTMFEPLDSTPDPTDADVSLPVRCRCLWRWEFTPKNSSVSSALMVLKTRSNALLIWAYNCKQLTKTMITELTTVKHETTKAKYETQFALSSHRMKYLIIWPVVRQTTISRFVFVCKVFDGTSTHNGFLC